MKSIWKAVIPKAKCIYCHKETDETNLFSDDSEGIGHHKEYCHDKCYEILIDNSH